MTRETQRQLYQALKAHTSELEITRGATLGLDLEALDRRIEAAGSNSAVGTRSSKASSPVIRHSGEGSRRNITDQWNTSRQMQVELSAHQAKWRNAADQCPEKQTA